MKLSSTKQVSLQEINLKSIDLLIVSSGYESRGTFLSSRINAENLKCAKVALGFLEHGENECRINNDEEFLKMGFKIVIMEGDENKSIYSLLDSYFHEKSFHKINILIDYSCMTRVWYASILKYFENASGIEECNIFFSYTPAKFTKPPDEHDRNLIVGPINEYCSLSIPNKPTGLIIGLGYVKERAYGLKDYLNAEQPFIMYGDYSYNPEYAAEVELRNKELLETINPEHIIGFPLNDISFTESLLLDLCNKLQSNYRIIIAPCGPKIFSLLSLIVSMKLEGIDVWRISAGKFAEPINKEHNNELLIYQTTFAIDSKMIK